MGSKPVEKTQKTRRIAAQSRVDEPRGLGAAGDRHAGEAARLIATDRERIVWNIRRLLDAAKALGVPIAGTEQYPERLSPTVPELKERHRARRPTSCASVRVCVARSFERWKNDGRYRVLVCGIETHVCILQTALDLAAAGFEPYVAVDAVGAHDTQWTTKRHCGEWNRRA